MKGFKYVDFLLTFYIIFSTCCIINWIGATVTEVAGEPTRKCNDVTEISDKEFTESVKFMKNSNILSKISEVLIHYTKHFMVHDKMTMRTKSGRITVPFTDKIQKNVSVMVKHIMALEYAAAALKDGSFDESNPIDRYRFIRNHTIVLDRIVDHVNACFTFHRDIENPEKLEVYNELKSDSRLLKIGHLYHSMKNLIQIQKDASPSFHELASGKLFGNKSSALNAEECLHLAEYVRGENISIAVQLYEAAVKRLDQYWALLRNRTQILHTIIEFYNQQGSECEDRVQKLYEKIKQIEIEKDDDDDDDDDDGDDEEKQKGEGAEKESRKGESNDELKEEEKTGEPEVEKGDNFDNIDIDEHDEQCFRNIFQKSLKILSYHDEL